MNSPRVMIGMPVGTGYIPWPTAVSLLATCRIADKGGIKVSIDAPLGCSAVSWARNYVVGSFLRSQCTHLFWIDSDIAWKPKDFLRLVGFGAIYPVIGALYPFKKEPPDFVLNTPGEPDQYEVDGHGNVTADSFAMGFTLVQREVIVRLAATKPTMYDSLAKVECPDMFTLDKRKPNGGALGEDVTFFNDVRALGYTPRFDPSIILDHIGQKAYRCDPLASLGLTEYTQEKQE